MDKQFKIFALEYIRMQENLTKEEKYTLGKFVVESEEDNYKERSKL